MWFLFLFDITETNIISYYYFFLLPLLFTLCHAHAIKMKSLRNCTVRMWSSQVCEYLQCITYQACAKPSIARNWSRDIMLPWSFRANLTLDSCLHHVVVGELDNDGCKRRTGLSCIVCRCTVAYSLKLKHWQVRLLTQNSHGDSDQNGKSLHSKHKNTFMCQQLYNDT